MKKKTLTWLLLLSLLINISAVATFAYYQWFYSEKSPKENIRRLHSRPPYRRLDLTAEQREAMHNLRKNLFNEIRPLHDQLQQKRHEMITLLEQDSVSWDQIEEKINQISEIEKQIQRNTISNFLEYAKVLTPEQREKFLRMMALKILDNRRGNKPFRYFKRQPKIDN